MNLTALRRCFGFAGWPKITNLQLSFPPCPTPPAGLSFSCRLALTLLRSGCLKRERSHVLVCSSFCLIQRGEQRNNGVLPSGSILSQGSWNWQLTSYLAGFLLLLSVTGISTLKKGWQHLFWSVCNLVWKGGVHLLVLLIPLWVRSTTAASIFGDIVACIRSCLCAYAGVSSLMLFINTARLAEHLKGEKAWGLPVFLRNTYFGNSKKLGASTCSLQTWMWVSLRWLWKKKPTQILPFSLTPQDKNKQTRWGCIHAPAKWFYSAWAGLWHATEDITF